MTTTTQKNHLAAIHMAHKALGLSKDDALALKMEIVGVESARDMTEQQRRRYLHHLSRLQSKQNGLPQPAPISPRNAVQRSVDDPKDARWGKARALWHVLATQGKVKTDTDAALIGFVSRQTGMDAWRFLNSYQVNEIIESLKRWVAR